MKGENVCLWFDLNKAVGKKRHGLMYCENLLSRSSSGLDPHSDPESLFEKPDPHQSPVDPDHCYIGQTRQFFYKILINVHMYLLI